MPSNRYIVCASVNIKVCRYQIMVSNGLFEETNGEVFFLKYFIIVFNGKSFSEKFLLTKKYYDLACAIKCTRKLSCVCACACACDGTRFREQYAMKFFMKLCFQFILHMHL